jgi:protocatechuate 3,4-dioxygenase beta subunit
VRRPGCLALAVVAVARAVPAPTVAAPGAAAGRPTPNDGAGPFGRGEPPVRSKIGKGHVLVGVVLAAPDCTPVARARVQFFQAGKNGVYGRAGTATVVTDRNGRFRFEGPVPGSDFGSAHIHIRVTAPPFRTLVTRYVLAPGERRGSIRLVLAPELL